jgi:hypothetical protein
MRVVVFTLLMVLLGSCSWSSRPVDAIGEVEASIGSPSVLRGSRFLEIGPKTPIFVKDTILTGTGGRVKLKMSDGTRITLGESSQFVFHVYSFAEPAPIARMSFSDGAFRIDTKKFTNMEKAIFEVSTPLATIGVRGTDFWGGYIFAQETLDVALLSRGEIYVHNDFGRVDISTPGVGTTITFKAPPSPPETWTPEKASEAIQSTTL